MDDFALAMAWPWKENKFKSLRLITIHNFTKRIQNLTKIDSNCQSYPTLIRNLEQPFRFN